MNKAQLNNLIPLLRQNGLTLVELMVSLFISLAVVGGILSFAASNKNTFTMQSEIGRLQENARFALDTLARNIGPAGFRTTEPPPGTGFGIVAFDFVTPNLPIDNISTNGTLNLNPADNRGSDILIINKESVAGAQGDCLGQNLAVNAQITNTYFIGDIDGNGLFDLYCLGNGNAASQVLVEGVDNMQILYGVDTDGDNIANQFISANNVMNINQNTTDWDGNIISIRISLLMSTVAPLRTGDVDVQTFDLLNTPPMGPLNDGANRIRQVFTRTILIRANLDRD